MMPADFYKETPWAFGHTTLHFQKSQKGVERKKDRYNSSSVFPSRLVFSFFATAHEGKNSFHKNKSYARFHRGMHLMHDIAASHTAHKTVKLPMQITDLNQIDHIWDIISCVERRQYPAGFALAVAIVAICEDFYFLALKI